MGKIVNMTHRNSWELEAIRSTTEVLLAINKILRQDLAEIIRSQELANTRVLGLTIHRLPELPLPEGWRERRREWVLENINNPQILRT